ncbi:MAG: autotransporter outer membrane beta-barrel domain-containing protein, partial [Synergistaceae bacterium]|nr:autotransporter outer membrane beta-barrel domain-containing protein [Synergistaceae bacterium]
VTLIAIEGTGNVTGGYSPQATGWHGATLQYSWTLEIEDEVGLTATVNDIHVNPRAEALLEGFLGGMILLNQGGDLVAGVDMPDALHGRGSYFGGISAGWSRHRVGSHVDMSGVSLLGGLSRGMDLSPGRLTLGAFFELGTGSYDTYKSLPDATSARGSGNTSYFGGGILGRMDFAGSGSGSGNFYADGSLRAGRLRNDYSGPDLGDGTGRGADFDSSSTYYGLHFAAGYIRYLSENTSLDTYARYYWTRLGGDSFILSTGDPVTFDAAYSSRLRLGARFSHAMSEQVNAYVGAAYEHEFDGTAAGATYGYPIDAPTMRGGTGIGDIGLNIRPSESLPLFIDVGVQGYTGRREGVTGRLEMRWEF